MNNQTYNPSIKFLLARILTIADVGIYLEYLRKIEMILYNANINVAEELSVILPHDVKESFLSIVHGSGIDMRDSQALHLLILDIKNKIQGIPVMGLTLAYEPTEKDLRDFSSFLFTNIGMQIIFHVVRDESILGGCKIEFAGKIADYTLKKELDQYSFGFQTGQM